MALKVKPKSFGPVFVLFDGSPELQYAYGDVNDTSPHPPGGTPVDTMIASLGSCIVRSVEWAANQSKAQLNPFQVRVVGIKSTELPGRIEKAEITIIGNLVDEEVQALNILKQAKAICTVSNSLNTTVEINIQAM
ncbi:OsmC family protein [Sulfitobacter sp. F26204]|uniref:OsmC family protein n=1 Tax=Sulfitobacter sp. F26204 TaxID=2996014 RepID=UPI00225DE108|nr:OsmC family protein [Sulfitobacter sp. F26204]MCX7560693.1 OsmC family protein [Sulfitobacter sp. F26204]